jgi:hypothetical protein
MRRFFGPLRLWQLNQMHPTSRKNPFRERKMQNRKHGIEADRQDRTLHHGSSPIALPWAAKKLQPMASSSYHCGL